MHSNKSSFILSEKVESNLSDAVANLKLLVKELASGNGNTSHMEVEKLMLQAEKVELEAAKLELESSRARFEAEKREFEAAGGSCGPDPKLEIAKAALKAERSQLEAEKTQLRVESLAMKVIELEKKLDQWFKDKKAMSNQIVRSDKVFLDLMTDSRRAARVVIKLDYDTTPLTAEKFKVLCTGERGFDPLYKGSNVYMGRYFISIANETSGDMYGSHFPPENLTKKHVPGAVSLTYHDGEVGSSMFKIMKFNYPDYDGENVVFGHVIEGMDLLMEMGPVGGGLVVECGQLR